MRPKKLLSYLLILCMLLGNVSFAFAEDVESAPELGKKATSLMQGGYIKEHFNVDLPEKYSKGYVPSDAGIEGYNENYYASKYISPYVTSIKNQSPYGTCWTFGSMATAEAYLIKSGATIDGVTYGLDNKNSLDLSELQLAFNCYNDRWDPLGNIIGDSVSIVDIGDGCGTSPLDSGGNYSLAMQCLLSWNGSTDEATMPYGDGESLLRYEDSVTYHDPEYGSYTKYNVPFYDESNKYETNETYINNSRDSKVHLQNAYIIPFNSVTTSNATTANQAIKDAIVDFGAVAISYMHADYLEKTVDTTYDADTVMHQGKECYVVSNNDTGAFYNPSDNDDLFYGEGGHAVTFVGWNDNYSKENFGITPPGDGAWIMKNSWGEHNGNNGYYYVSYYETSLQEYEWKGETYHEEAYALLFESADNYDYNYQYDSVGGGWYYTFDEPGTIGATYTVKDSNKQVLEAVGIEIDTPDVNYSVQVYDNNGKALLKDPSNGKASPVTGKTTFAGYTTIKIPENQQPILTKDSNETGTFTVEISLSKDSGDFVIPIERTDDYGGWANITCNTENDLTYFANYSADKMTNSNARDYGNEDADPYTLHIKAYTSNAEYPTYVRSTPITVQNASNVLGDGKVSYTPATNESNAVLKLKDAKLTDVADYAISTTEPLIVEIEGDCEIETTSNNIATLIDINNVDEEEDGYMTIKGVGNKPATLTITSNNNVGVFGIAGPDVHDTDVNNGVLTIQDLELNISGKSIGIGVNKLTIKNSDVYVGGIIRSKTSMTIDGSTVIANTTINNPSSKYKNTIGTEGTLTITNGSEIYAGGVNDDYAGISANQISLTSEVDYKFLGSTKAQPYDNVEDVSSEIWFINNKYRTSNSAGGSVAATAHIFPVQKAAFDNGKLKWAGYLEEGSMSVVASYTNGQFVNAVLSSPTSSAGYNMLEFLLSDYGPNSKLMFVNAQSYQPIYREIILN